MADDIDDVHDAEMQAELRLARQRFAVSFERRCIELTQLAQASGATGPHEEFARAVHRLVGSAGLVGFMDVSRLASAMEPFAREASTSGAQLAERVETLREAYTRDEAAPPAWATQAGMPAAAPLTLLVAEDDDQQRTAVVRFLEAAGHRVTGVARGDEVLAAVKRHKPSILLLDVQLPGLDGYAVCRQIKTDPALSSVAVVFLTAAVSSDERMTGLLLGADDYVEKPVDLPDLALRVALVAERRAASPGDAPVLAAGELSYPDFVVRVTAALQQSGGALVLIRVPARMGTRVAAWLSGELRSDDLLGRYREEVRMLFLPGYLSQSAAHYVADLVSRLGRTGLVVHAGFGVAERPGERTLGALLQDADARLAASAAARPAQAASGDAVPEQEVRRTSVLIADDDPLVRSLAERPLVRAGFLCREAVDGQHALEQVHAECPDVLVLDLSMPRLDGLQVLEVLRRERHTDLRVIVISSSRQADDVKKAISLGARDYIVKPFNPLTLLTRVRQVLD